MLEKFVINHLKLKNKLRQINYFLKTPKKKEVSHDSMTTHKKKVIRCVKQKELLEFLIENRIPIQEINQNGFVIQLVNVKTKSIVDISWKQKYKHREETEWKIPSKTFLQKLILQAIDSLKRKSLDLAVKNMLASPNRTHANEVFGVWRKSFKFELEFQLAI